MGNTQKKRLDYKWVVVSACFLMIFTTLGFCSSTKKLFLVPVTEALGILRGVYSVNDSFRYITTSVVNIFFGALVVKFGPRKLIGMGFLSLIGSMLMYSFAVNVAMIYIGGCLLGLGLAMTTTTMVGYVVNIWCEENRGTIMGIILCANGFGGALATQILSPVIVKDYRIAYRLMALILLTVGALVVAVFRNAPKGAALPQQTAGKKKPKGNSWSGVTLKQALKEPYFYTSCACIFLTGMCLQSVVGVDAAHMTDRGMDTSFMASVFSISSLVLAASKFLVGACYDRKGLKFTMLICDISAIAMMVMLILVSNSPLGMGLACGYATITALALPLESIMLPLIAADLFGEKEYGKLLGIFVSVNTAGYACGPIITNFVFDKIGSYVPILVAYVGIMVAITLAFLVCQKQAEKVKNEIALQEAGE